MKKSLNICGIYVETEENSINLGLFEVTMGDVYKYINYWSVCLGVNINWCYGVWFQITIDLFVIRLCFFVNYSKTNKNKSFKMHSLLKKHCPEYSIDIDNKLF